MGRFGGGGARALVITFEQSLKLDAIYKVEGKGLDGGSKGLKWKETTGVIDGNCGFERVG